MIYLVTQIALCLLLAAVAGGAVGWLLQRGRGTARFAALRENIIRQHQQLQQARTDVAMLTEDYDDLKRRSQDEIDELRQENRRLPNLLQNLEKSQTLVRQLMQKHELQVRELVQENERLSALRSSTEAREQAYLKAQAELEQARRRVLALESMQATAEVAPKPATAPKDTVARVATAAASTYVATPESAAPDVATPDSAAANVTATADVIKPGGAASDAPLAATITATTDRPADAEAPAPTELRKTDRARAGGSWASARVVDVEQVRSSDPVESEDSFSPPGETESRSGHDVLSERAGIEGGVDLDAAEVTFDSVDEDSTDHAVADHDVADDDSSDDESADEASGDAEVVGAEAWDDEAVADGAPEDDTFASGLIADHVVPEADDGHGTELDDEVEGDDIGGHERPATIALEAEHYRGRYLRHQRNRLFEPVDRHDDLKQIFGIGPVTEKALNKLGITSYSQLADLKHHEIEKIADALQIFPSRIERDDWAGNARRQLEEVLEEL